MARFRDLMIDAYSALTHKAIVSDASRYNAELPTWLHLEHQRRLASYRVLGAYQENVARHLLRSQPEAGTADSYREYGDPALLVARVVSGVLGDTMELVVDGADSDLPALPAIPDRPEELEPDADQVAQRIHAIREAAWSDRATTAIDTWEEAGLAQPELQARQDWLREWADRELLEQKVWEAETDAVGLGDGVYVLGWSAQANRPRLRIYPPDAYFPVLDDAAEARGFPARVHIAWEFEETTTVGGTDTERHLRVLTYELGPIAGEPDADGTPGPGTRRYPWQDTDDELATETCYMTDATYRVADIKQGVRLTDLTPASARYAENEDGDTLERLDLRIDFIPVIHVPNTPADQAHFGRSILSRVLQLLDDVAATDTDLMAAAALAGTPMIALSGDRAPQDDLTVRPGMVIGIGANGRMDVIDLSASVTALQGVAEALLDRLAVNTQVPGEVVGRVDDTGPESGFARSLKLGPYDALVGVLRLVRTHKYALLLRFTQRMAQAGGTLEPGPTPAARVQFGSYLPEDEAGVVELVTKLLTARAISRRTALLWLQATGIAVDDISEELDRIQAEDFLGAQALFDATDDDSAVRAYLGLVEQADARPDEPPALDLPGRRPPAPGVLPFVPDGPGVEL